LAASTPAGSTSRSPPPRSPRCSGRSTSSHPIGASPS
jgi:hypothetical protein